MCHASPGAQPLPSTALAANTDGCENCLFPVLMTSGGLSSFLELCHRQGNQCCTTEGGALLREAGLRCV